MGGKAKVDGHLADADYTNENAERFGVTLNSTIDISNIWVFMEDAIESGIIEMLDVVHDDITTVVTSLTEQMDSLIDEMEVYAVTLEMNNDFYMYVM